MVNKLPHINQSSTTGITTVAGSSIEIDARTAKTVDMITDAHTVVDGITDILIVGKG